MRRLIITPFIVLFLVTGCTSKFACQETIDGVQCKNLGAVYNQRVLGEGEAQTATSVYDKKVIGQKKESGVTKNPSELSEAEKVVRNLGTDKIRPLRIPPTIVKIWIAPWEDSDGDLHKPGDVYCEISEKRGRWLFGEQAVVSGYTAPTRPSVRNPEEENKKATGGTKAPQKSSTNTPPRSNQKKGNLPLIPGDTSMNDQKMKLGR